jgi:hypothetical protein
MYIYDTQFLLQSEMFQTKVVEKIKTHVLYSIILFPPKSVSFMKKCEKNVAEVDRPQMTIRRMFFACRITKGTDR